MTKNNFLVEKKDGELHVFYNNKVYKNIRLQRPKS